MGKHTPGPWAVKPIKKFSLLAEVVSLDGPVIDEGFSRSNETEMANANLIAASPEMLKVLKKIRHKLDNYDGESMGQLAAIADEAIAKAEGRE